MRGIELYQQPSGCRSLEIPTEYVYVTKKDVIDNQDKLIERIESENVYERVARDILACKRIKDNTFVDISLVATNRGPVSKGAALIFCWKMKGSKR